MAARRRAAPCSMVRGSPDLTENFAHACDVARTDWDFLPPKTIKDPAVSKPSDWVDEPMMDDPADTKVRSLAFAFLSFDLHC